MKVSPTLNGYLARLYLINLLYLLFVLLGILYLFDAVELIRRASKTDVSLFLVLEMAFFKLPKEGQTLFPFAVLYGAMFTFWQLTRRFELVVVRAAGFSVWQFLFPILAVAAVAGAIHVTVINPVSSVLVSQYDQMESKYLKIGDDNQIALFREGLWLRQMTPEGYLILHSRKIEQPDWSLQNPFALFFTMDDRFIKRIDAARAKLEPERWVFEDVTVQNPEGIQHQNRYELPTTLTRSAVENSFSSPSTMSFWRLGAHIQTLEETGFDPTRLRVAYQSLLAQPLLFAALILLAACVTLQQPRSQRTLNSIVAGIFIGFVVFFLTSFLQAMGATHQIPVLLAAWSPAVISLFMGLGIMMTLEDG